MKKFFKLFVLMLTAFTICGCLAEEKVVTADMRGGKIKKSVTNSEAEAPARDPIDDILKSMTLEEKIGQSRSIVI